MYQLGIKTNDRWKDILCPKLLVELSFKMGTTGVPPASTWKHVIAPINILYCMYEQIG